MQNGVSLRFERLIVRAYMYARENINTLNININIFNYGSKH